MFMPQKDKRCMIASGQFLSPINDNPDIPQMYYQNCIKDECGHWNFGEKCCGLIR